MDDTQGEVEKDSRSGLYNDITWEMSNPTEVKCYKLECNLRIQSKINAIIAAILGAVSGGLIAWLTR